MVNASAGAAATCRPAAPGTSASTASADGSVSAPRSSSQLAAARAPTGSRRRSSHGPTTTLISASITAAMWASRSNRRGRSS